MPDSTPKTAKAAGSIIHPVFDVLAIGGLSIVFIMALLLFEVDLGIEQRALAEKYIIFHALLNWPHFMATYALMYKSRETIERYPVASKWMPLALGVTCVAAVTAQIAVGFEGSLDVLFWMSGGYLAWHYTGQTWGMMASFSHLDNARFEDRERFIIRAALKVLLLWHFIWFFGTVQLGGPPFKNNEQFLVFYSVATFTLLPIGAIVGAYGLFRYSRRIDRTPPLRVLVPFVAIVLWYVAMAINPISIFFVQLFHAMQYLLFPLRVEINRGEARGRNPYQSAVIFAMLVLGLGLAAFLVFPRLLTWAIPAATLATVQMGVGAFVNVHHYFADGVIWKLSNPAVRKELFAHIPRG